MSAGAGLIGGERFDDAVEDLPLADRPAIVGAAVLVGIELLAATEDADLERTHGEDAVVLVGELAQIADRDLVHVHPRFSASRPSQSRQRVTVRQRRT